MAQLMLAVAAVLLITQEVERQVAQAVAVQVAVVTVRQPITELLVLQIQAVAVVVLAVRTLRILVVAVVQEL
jgi:hypothetical protein